MTSTAHTRTREHQASDEKRRKTSEHAENGSSAVRLSPPFSCRSGSCIGVIPHRRSSKRVAPDRRPHERVLVDLIKTAEKKNKNKKEKKHADKTEGTKSSSSAITFKELNDSSLAADSVMRRLLLPALLLLIALLLL
jgi:hypothetical protein